MTDPLHPLDGLTIEQIEARLKSAREYEVNLSRETAEMIPIVWVWEAKWKSGMRFYASKKTSVETRNAVTAWRAKWPGKNFPGVYSGDEDKVFGMEYACWGGYIVPVGGGHVVLKYTRDDPNKARFDWHEPLAITPDEELALRKGEVPESLRA